MPPQVAAPPDLDEIDLRILELLATGATGASVPRRLGLPPRTVQRRIQRFRAAWNARTTMEAVALAVRAGVI